MSEADMSTDPMSARAALDEVARRQDQALAAGNNTWSWRSVLSTCAALLIMGVGVELDQVWVAAAVVGIFAFTRSAVTLRSDTRRGPGAGFTIALLIVVVVTTLVTAPLWRGLGLALPGIAATVAGCLVMLAATPLAQRRIAAQNARVTRIPATGSR